MNALIGDIGNTTTKICLIEIKTFKVKKIINFNSNNISSKNFLKKNFSKILKKKSVNKVSLFSSVVPKYQSILEKFLKKNYNIQFREIKEKNINKIVKINIKNKKLKNIRSTILLKKIINQVKLKKMSEKLVKDILNIYGYTSARVVIREDIDSEQLVDFLIGNKTYAKSITVLNKIDLVDKKLLRKVSKKLKTEFIPVSADASDNIAELRDRIYDELQFIRIYLRPKGGKTDYKEPLIIRNGNSVLDVCNKLHRKLRKNFRYGLVWGKSVKFGGQRVGLKHILIDEDVLTIIKTKGT